MPIRVQAPAASSPSHRLPRSRRSSGNWASEVFCESLAKCRHIEHRLRQQLLELAVFILECLQPAGVGHLHAAVLRTPRVKRRIADPVLAAQLDDRNARLVLLQHLDDLLLAEPSLAHSSVSLLTDPSF